MSEYSRRKFLENSVKSLGALGMTHMMSNFIIQSIASSAKAQTSAFSNKIYIFIQLNGAPPKWLFDVPLTPNGNANNYTDHFSHPCLGTAVEVVSGKAEVVYKPWRDPVSKYWLPPVWGSNPAGGSFSNCLSNAAFIRGVNYELDNHELGAINNQAPVNGGLSIAGAFANQTNSIFHAATGGGFMNRIFKGPQNKSPIQFDAYANGNDHPINRMMDYFKGQAVQNNAATKTALDEFSKYAGDHKFELKSLKAAKEKSDALITQGISVFTNQWDPVFSKYKIRVSQALTNNANVGNFMSGSRIPRPADVDGKPHSGLSLDGGNFIGNYSDLKNISYEAKQAETIATLFATMEILITSGLSQTVSTDINAFIHPFLAENSTNTAKLEIDQHGTGNIISTIGTTFYYRTMLTCLEELIVVLKSKNLFDKTLIEFGSEFNRKLRADGTGSDHGPTGSANLLISGMITKTVVVGNIKDEKDGDYRGTWGIGENHAIGGGTQEIRRNDVIKTVCGMLDIPNVATNGSFVLRNTGTQWEAFADARGEAKNAA